MAEYVGSLAESAWSGKLLTDDGDGTITKQTRGIGCQIGANNSVGTVAFSTVMGGAGAALSCGNFWEGAVTGFIVGAYNHVEHMHIQRRPLTLLERFKTDANGNYLTDPFSSPDFSRKGVLSLNNNVDGLSEAYANGGKPSFKFDLTGDVGFTEDGTVNLNKSKLQTNYRLVSTLFHEYRHAWQQLSIGGQPSRRNVWYSKYAADVGHQLGERDAYGFQIQMGGGDLPEVREWFLYYYNATKYIKQF